MTADRRLANVELALTPTQLVVRWLTEIHQFEEMTAYMRWLVDRPPTDFPMDRLAREARESARARSRRQPGKELDEVVRRTVVETLFRVQLVIEINVRSADCLDRQALIHAALAATMALHFNVPDAPMRGTALERVVENRDLLLRHVFELHAFEAARDAVEARYLGGTPADFPAARRAWDQQIDLSERSAVLSVRGAELDGGDPPPGDDPVAFESRVATLSANFVQPARSKTYSELGDGWKAHAVAKSWLKADLLKDEGALKVEPSGSTL